MALDQKVGKAYRSSSNADGSNKALPPRPHEQPQPTPRRSKRSSIAVGAGSFSRSGTAADRSFYYCRSETTRPDPDLSLPPAASSRTSFVSIIDDPFFLQYRAPEDDKEDTTQDADDESTPAAAAANLESPRDESSLRWPPPRRESLTIGQYLAWSQSQSQSKSQSKSQSQSNNEMASLNIAVIGAKGVGKSGFIERVMGLSRPPISNTSQARKVVDGVPYLVTLLELELEHFELNPELPIQWPRQINGHIVPRVDGALIIYDITAMQSLDDLPKTLAALTNSGLPTILVANKCDAPAEDRQADSQKIAEHLYFRACVASYDVSASEPGSSKACLDAIMRAASAYRSEPSNSDSGIPRRRAQSAANILETPMETSRPLSVHSKHSRASSDLSALQGIPVPASGQSSRSPRIGSTQEEGEKSTAPTVSSLLRTTGVRLDKGQPGSFLDIEESDPESMRCAEDVPILQRNDDTLDDRPKAIGVTFEDLVDRLLALKMSKADNHFTDVFLCLYRKFAAPGELFSAVLTRLDRVRDDRSAHYLSKTATQLRIIEVVAKWVSLYPGDFARPATRRNLVDFIRHLSTEPIFFLAAQQMRRNVDNNVAEDDDTGWAKCDDTVDTYASSILLKDPITIPELSTGFGAFHLGDDFDDRPSTNSDFSHLDQGSAYSTHFQFSSFEEYEREAAQCEPVAQFPLTKQRYRNFMELSDDEVAEEITRIDWVMFSSIRIRDFVRHVSLPTDQKNKCRSLKNVNRMISHFNHVAKWVASMILFRDKAKHRALCLEKFMNIASKLRIMNNYNGLAAVLAGINGAPIHRLVQTRALVPAEVQKRFARLVILMGTQKSHFAYRLAWENSSFPRIPFMPLHRRDLVSAEEGGKTLIGPQADRINWKKFEVLGEVLLPIMKSQGTPYPNLVRHDGVRIVMMECQLQADDEELYTRSEHVESPAGAPGDSSYRKKFAWLRI